MSEPTPETTPATTPETPELDAFIAQLSDSIAATDTGIAVAIVKRAATIASRMRAEGLVTEYKTSISDVVTAADRAAEKFVVDALARLRPEDGILGEEGSAKESASGRTWVIDPVDGTYNFTSGSDYWCSALALATGDVNDPDDLILGAVHRPATGETWIGGPELPTTRINLNGTVDDVQVDNRPLAEVCAATYLHTTVVGSDDETEVAATRSWLDAVSRCATWRMLGSASVDMAGVVDGRLGVWFQRDVAPWDWLPGRALIEGGGGDCAAVGRWKVVGSEGQVAALRAVLK
nr:inositol monophosphatase [Corynebacterium lactis]